MEYWEEALAGLQKHFRFVIGAKRGEIIVSGFIIPTEITIGGTTYLVSSFFKNYAKGNAVDKIARLIERDAENIVNIS